MGTDSSWWRSFAPQFPLSWKFSRLHRACPGSYLSLIVLRTPKPSHRLSFQYHIRSFDLTIERESVCVWYFAVGDPQCSYYQFWGLLQKKKQKKTAFCCTLSSLLVVLSISLVASSVCIVFSTIIQLCIIFWLC
jgi:hypothetical protein